MYTKDRDSAGTDEKVTNYANWRVLLYLQKIYVYFNVFLIFLWAHLCKDMGLALCLLRVKSHSLKTLWFGLMVIISVVDIYFVILLINSRNTFHYLKTPHPLELTGQVRFPVGHDAEDAGVVSMTCQQCSIYYKTLIKCGSLLFNNHCNHSTEISYKISYRNIIQNKLQLVSRYPPSDFRSQLRNVFKSRVE